MTAIAEWRQWHAIVACTFQLATTEHFPQHRSSCNKPNGNPAFAVSHHQLHMFSICTAMQGRSKHTSSSSSSDCSSSSSSSSSEEELVSYIERLPLLAGALLTFPFTAGPPARGGLLRMPGLESGSCFTPGCCCCTAPAALLPIMNASKGSISSSSSAHHQT